MSNVWKRQVTILCVTSRTTVTSSRILEEDACHRAHNLCVFSHVQKGTPGLTHKGCVLQRVSLGALSDVMVVLGMRPSIVCFDMMGHILVANWGNAGFRVPGVQEVFEVVKLLHNWWGYFHGSQGRSLYRLCPRQLQLTDDILVTPIDLYHIILAKVFLLANLHHISIFGLWFQIFASWFQI